MQERERVRRIGFGESLKTSQKDVLRCAHLPLYSLKTIVLVCVRSVGETAVCVFSSENGLGVSGRTTGGTAGVGTKGKRLSCAVSRPVACVIQLVPSHVVDTECCDAEVCMPLSIITDGMLAACAIGMMQRLATKRLMPIRAMRSLCIERLIIPTP